MITAAVPRPMYESSSDLSNEDRIRRDLEEYWHVTIVKLPIAYRVDFSILNRYQVILGWLEAKDRKHASDRYPTVILSLHKAINGVILAERTDTPFIFAVRFTDRLMYHHITEIGKYALAMGGRTVNTRDPQDVEPVIHIPVNQFIEVTHVPV